jgi:hypothetical protein
MSRGIFIAGTDTDVGKTRVTLALAAGAAARLGQRRRHEAGRHRLPATGHLTELATMAGGF